MFMHDALGRLQDKWPYLLGHTTLPPLMPNLYIAHKSLLMHSYFADMILTRA